MTSEEVFNLIYEGVGEALCKTISEKEEEKMNNKRINILAEGEWVLPKGTNVKKYNKKLSEWKCARSMEVNACISSDVYEVDFSEVPPLYPHKGMHVPEEGIEFRIIYGKLLLVGNFGIALSRGSEHILYDWCFVSGNTDELELKRTLPKTINVCSECFKEVCECKHEEGWYWVFSLNSKWYLRYFDGKDMLTHKDGRVVGTYKSVDWDNIIRRDSENK